MALEPTIAPNADADDYWSQTRRPFVCLIFLLPLLVAYEAGVLWVGGETGALRNGADVWMRNGLAYIGLAHGWLLPVLVGGILLGWQIAGEFPWRVSVETLAGMVAESLLFAILLVVIGQLQDFIFQQCVGSDRLQMVFSPAEAGHYDPRARLVAFIGAGVYEEVLFRLCLLPACYGLFRLTGLTNGWAAALAALVTSLTFSLAHYVGPGAEPLRLFSFTFRALAGAFFAALFLLRGFGITVGCHTIYDLLVGLVLNS